MNKTDLPEAQVAIGAVEVPGYPACKTCRWWEQHDTHSVNGTPVRDCARSSSHGFGPAFIAGDVLHDSASVRMVTPAWFGCIHHEPVK